MLEPLIQPDKQPVPELMTQLAATRDSFNTKSLSKGRTERTVMKFCHCFSHQTR